MKAEKWELLKKDNQMENFKWKNTEFEINSL